MREVIALAVMTAAALLIWSGPVVLGILVLVVGAVVLFALRPRSASV
jgi:hypothetical protein